MSTFTRGTMKQLMGRLDKIKKESGGIDESAAPELGISEAEAKKLTKFDLTKLSCAKKLTKTRENIKERDAMVEGGKGRTTECIKLSNDIKKMVMSIKFDFEQLQQEVEEDKKKKKLKPEIIQQREDDVALIGKHVEAVEKESKQKPKKAPARKRRNRDGDDDDKLMEGAEDTGEGAGGEGGEGGSGEGGAGGGGASLAMQHVVKEQDMGANTAGLPEIDISDALKKLDDMKEQVDKVLDKVSQQLDILKDKTKDITEAVDKSLEQLDNVEKKVDKNNEDLVKLNKDIEKKINAVSKSTIYVIIICLTFLLILLIVLVYVGVALLLIFGGGFINQFLPKSSS